MLWIIGILFWLFVVWLIVKMFNFMDEKDDDYDPHG